MPRPTPLFAAFSLTVALILATTAAGARQVTGLSASSVNGQTVITWDNLPGKGWTYHVVASDMPLLTADDVWTYSYEIGVVGDSSAMDRRMSRLLGRVVTFRTDSAGPEQPIGRGLFVSTPYKDGLRYYAVWLDSMGLGLEFKVVPDQNTLTSPVWEVLSPPRPVWQRTLTVPRCEDYVLFAPSADTRLFPAMWSVDNFARHIGVIRGAPGGGLVLHGHGRGGSFLNSCVGTGLPGETVLAPDDYLPTPEVSTFYLGYSTMYDPAQPDSRPMETGQVVDYTDRFVMYTLDWAMANFGSDPNRVYAMGSSMGGTFAYFLAWHHPDRIAAAMSFIPKLRLGHAGDTAPSIIASFENMWSRLDMNLPLIQGVPVFDWMDAPSMMQRYYTRGAPPVIGFAGRNDHIVGWQEKLGVFEALGQYRVGGAWYWDNRSHTNGSTDSWAPVQSDWRQLYRYRLDRSFPALSNCSVDSDPGDGTTATGDSVGTINGFVEWDEAIVDTRDRWEVVLRSRTLPTRTGTLAPQGPVSVDVTPRRLQEFVVSSRTEYRFDVYNATTDAWLTGGTASADADYVLTLPGIPVVSSGSRVVLRPFSSLDVAGAAPPRLPVLAMAANPVRGSTSLGVRWPASGQAQVDLVDPAGRRARTLFSGFAEGSSTVTLDTGGLAPGVYLVHARQGGLKSSKRVVVVH